MTEIYVEEKQGVPFWVWPAALLVILLLAAMLMLKPGTEEQVTTTTTTTNQAAVIDEVANTTNAPLETTKVTTTTTHQTDSSGNTTVHSTKPQISTHQGDKTAVTTTTRADGTHITEVTVFSSTPDQTTLADKTVDFKNVSVKRVISDRFFTVNSGNREMFAMLNDGLNDGAMEKHVQIKPGQILSLGGEFELVPSGEVQKEQSSDLPMTKAELTQLKDQKIYLHVTSIQ